VGGPRSGKEAALRCAAGRDPFAGDVLVAGRPALESLRGGGGWRQGGGVETLAAAGVGVCLRDNALWNHLTAAEHLTLHATLRGLRNPRRVAYATAEAAGLASNAAAADASADGFSGAGNGSGAGAGVVARKAVAAVASLVSGGGGRGGGGGGGPAAVRAAGWVGDDASLLTRPVRSLNASQQRQLALAVALIGHPPLLLLDCPTQSVDSAARRSIWVQLAEHARRGGAILMVVLSYSQVSQIVYVDHTGCHQLIDCFDCNNVSEKSQTNPYLTASDAVDEVEVLCTRVAALVDGELVTIGTPQQLKARHGTAYTLRVQLRAETSGGGAGGGSAGAGGGGGGGAAASREDVEALQALVNSAAPTVSSSTFDGARGCSHELKSLDLPSLVRGGFVVKGGKRCFASNLLLFICFPPHRSVSKENSVCSCTLPSGAPVRHSGGGAGSTG
jgi:ABC-type multidrug transport system ATPase subunit